MRRIMLRHGQEFIGACDREILTTSAGQEVYFALAWRSVFWDGPTPYILV